MAPEGSISMSGKLENPEGSLISRIGRGGRMGSRVKVDADVGLGSRRSMEDGDRLDLCVYVCL